MDLTVKRFNVGVVKCKTGTLGKKTVQIGEFAVKNGKFQIDVIRKKSDDIGGAGWMGKGVSGERAAAFFEKIGVVATKTGGNGRIHLGNKLFKIERGRIQWPG
jgi:hypothetical protein